MTIKELIPAISDELAYLWDLTSSELKSDLNGFLPEQRVFVIARANYEILKEKRDPDVRLAQKLWMESGDLVIELGKVKLLPLKPELKSAFDAATNVMLRPKLIDTIMCWSPDWESIVNSLLNEQYEFGQNRFVITAYQGDEQRSTVKIMCGVIGFIDESSPGYNLFLPKFKIGDRVLISTLQLETVLNRRVD